VNDIKHLHDSGTVIRDGDRVSLAVDELVHATRAKSGADDIDYSLAGVDVADELGDTLRRICTLTEQDDTRLLQSGKQWGRDEAKQVVSNGNLG
jgi:hypothetical protein